jgi:hypothetical protein
MRELTRWILGGYARFMFKQAMALTLMWFAWAPAQEVPASGEPRATSTVPLEDYALYDQVVTKKFLTSDTRMVVLERMTVSRLSPDQDGTPSIAFFREQGYFGGELPEDLVRDFVGANREPSRLEGRFRFGLRYRFVSGNAIEEPEVASAVAVTDDRTVPVQAAPVLDRLAFSRVGRTLRNDQALLYVENLRPDGTGAGFLVWFRRQGGEWSVFDTEVVWTVRRQDAEEGPLLAP